MEGESRGLEATLWEGGVSRDGADEGPLKPRGRGGPGGEEQRVQRPHGELISWRGEVWEVRGYARTRAEEGHELTAILGGEEAGTEKGSGSRGGYTE